jgi:hypothetical protein
MEGEDENVRPSAEKVGNLYQPSSLLKVECVMSAVMMAA